MNRHYLLRMRLLEIFVSLSMVMPIWAQMARVPENMSFIASGRTKMGIDRDELLRFQEVFRIKTPQLLEDEIPKHTVEVDSFYIDKQLVTNAQFEEFIDRNPAWSKDGIDQKLHNGSYLEDWTGNRYPEGKLDHPVVNVSWYAAVAYCQWGKTPANGSGMGVRRALEIGASSFSVG
jgi:formylglycine-generating enzyme required for sulfatase activity